MIRAIRRDLGQLSCLTETHAKRSDNLAHDSGFAIAIMVGSFSNSKPKIKSGGRLHHDGIDRSGQSCCPGSVVAWLAGGRRHARAEIASDRSTRATGRRSHVGRGARKHIAWLKRVERLAVWNERWTSMLLKTSVGHSLKACAMVTARLLIEASSRGMGWSLNLEKVWILNIWVLYRDRLEPALVLHRLLGFIKVSLIWDAFLKHTHIWILIEGLSVSQSKRNHVKLIVSLARRLMLDLALSLALDLSLALVLVKVRNAVTRRVSDYKRTSVVSLPNPLLTYMEPRCWRMG
ncbi:hypothetical protein V8C34DRAFT_239247 [Trichoderma compactum]